MILPPRLSIIMASQKPRAVILRRGPSKWFHVILWDTAKDTFEYGAWFKGRIYEERCSLSPDGALFLYFALQGNKWGTSYEGAWTAVSRPPWLFALTLWPQGDTWGGGGCFIGNRELILETGHLRAHPSHPCRGLNVKLGHCSKNSENSLASFGEWAGLDHSGYEIYTHKGKLFRKLKHGDKKLADFNDLKPEPKEAPKWAKKL